MKVNFLKMADRLSQLQDQVNLQAQNLCNALGVIQQTARPNNIADMVGFDRAGSVAYQQVLKEMGIPDLNMTNGGETNGESKPQDNGKFFAKLVAQTSRRINSIIDTLPKPDMEGEIQESHIRNLSEENREVARKLEAKIEQCEDMQRKIQNALDDIASTMMKIEATHQVRL